jgi:CheY-like chemotaxis protein
MAGLMGGTIAVESEVGKGTVFTVAIECGSVPAEQVLPAAECRKDSFDLKGIHVLLCEDHPLNQEIARLILEQKGILVETAENGQEGVQKFSRSAIYFYSAVLMDIRMPLLDGYAAASAIRSLNRADAVSVPIIAMSADAFTDDVNRCLDAGMNGHIAKPIDPVKLYAVLQEAVQHRRFMEMEPDGNTAESAGR